MPTPGCLTPLSFFGYLTKEVISSAENRVNEDKPEADHQLVYHKCRFPEIPDLVKGYGCWRGIIVTIRATLEDLGDAKLNLSSDGLIVSFTLGAGDDEPD